MHFYKCVFSSESPGPQSGPCGRGLVYVSNAVETHMPRAGVGGLGRQNSDFCRIFEFQAGLCLYAAIAVKGGSLGQAVRGRSDQPAWRFFPLPFWSVLPPL